MGDFLQSIKPKFIKKLEKALEPPGQKPEEEKTPTAAGIRKKQGPGFWMGDIGEEEPKKREHYKKGNPKKIKVGF